MKFKIGDWLSQRAADGYYYIFKVINVWEDEYLVKFKDGTCDCYHRKEIEDNYMGFYPAQYLTDEEKAELL